MGSIKAPADFFVTSVTGKRNAAAKPPAGNVVNLKKKPLWRGKRFLDATRGSADKEVNRGGAVVAAFN